MLSQNDWNFNNIGTKFELDEVIPKFETEVRADANGEIQMPWLIMTISKQWMKYQLHLTIYKLL